MLERFNKISCDAPKCKASVEVLETANRPKDWALCVVRIGYRSDIYVWLCPTHSEFIRTCLPPEDPTEAPPA